ncbi:MAG TPA: hypothetical protein VFA27_16200 [Vicinamibacterales bacterium]|nr:hypothetical protein [Vicinamibacterales bacterium]
MWLVASLLGAGVHAAAAADTTPPAIVASATPVANANGWNRTNVTVRFTCTAAGSKIAFCPPSVVVSTEGANQIVSGTVRDKAGRTATATVTLNIDKTPPVVVGTRSPSAPPGGWSSMPVTVTFDASDALSGVDPASVTAPVTVGDRRNGSVKGTAKDLAGNVGTFTLTDINVDTHKPAISVTLTPAAVNGYRPGPVTAHFTCTDALSGIASCPADQVFATDGKGQVATGTATDIAGNAATVSTTFTVDSTPPAIAITSAIQSPTSADTITIGGTVADAISGVATLVADGTAVTVRGGAFTYGPAALSVGDNQITLTATDRAGNAVQRTVTVTRTSATPPPPPPDQVNLVQDPQFDAGTSSFAGQDDSTVVQQTNAAPLEGANSLHVAINGYGNNVWWTYDFAGGLASGFRVGAHLRSDVASTSTLQFCAMVYYGDGSTDLNCANVSGSVGDKGTVSASLALDAAKPLANVNIRLIQQGAAPVSFTLDAATAFLDVVSPPPTGGNGGGNGGGSGSGGSGGSGSSAPACGTSPNTIYHGFTYHLPSARPFISLNDYTVSGANTPAARRLIDAANQTLAGNPPYLFGSRHMVLAFRLTGDARYLQWAITDQEQVVTDAEAAIAAGHEPAIAGDSYLDIGAYLDDLALTYDTAFDRLTADQRTRWAAFAEQAIFNLWHPNDAAWGGVSHPWSGWAICDPGDNYHYSFMRATMLWALATQDTSWFDFLQTQKFGPLVDYFAALPGGGTREGTGYGTALNDLFGDYIYWKASTGEDLAALSPHTRETIDYWVHATVPTLDRFAPIADLSRESIPNIFDYQVNLVEQAVRLSEGTVQARHGVWWLQNNSLKNGVGFPFNLFAELLPRVDPAEQPTDLMYFASGAGALFARTAWTTDASWIAFIAGKYDQSHAHQEQGNFTFFKHDWLSVTSNIWSHSGIHQEVEVNNIIRFQRANGDTIPQNQGDNGSTMTPSTANGETTVTADLSNAYSDNRSAVQSWTRTLQLNGDVLRVIDSCTVASGVTPVFQVNVPVQPVPQQDGSIVAGHLRVIPRTPVTYQSVTLDPSEFTSAFRIDLTSTAGCAFDVQLQYIASASTPPPSNDQPPPPPPSPPPLPPGTPAPTPADGSADPVEPVWSEVGTATRIKSPAPHMHFTVGAPFRILADAEDINAWMCPPGHPPYVCPGTGVTFYVDGQAVGTVPPSETDFNLWEVRLPNGLPQGDHVLQVKYVPYNPSTGGGGTPIDGLVPVTVHVDAPAAHTRTVVLTQNLILSGPVDLDWADTAVVGNGFTVTSASGYSGRVLIDNANVTGLGSYGTPGLDVVTSGAVSIQNSTFEATGAVRVGVQGSASITIKGNELRANNFVTYVADDPEVPVMLELVGDTTGAKVVQGNRVAAGILRITRGSYWQIGGLSQGDGNILIGPRAVLQLVDTSNDTIQGNYLHHDYHGGFSQGMNLWFEGSSNHALAEHNVIRGGSWPVQSFGGEFRYNLIVDSGHDFWRSAADATSIHHNVFANASGVNTGYDGAVKVYSGETHLSIVNNTFDVGGAVGAFDAPAFNIGPGTLFDSIRNNLFANFIDVTPAWGRAIVSAPDDPVSAPRVTASDYNAFFNPLAPATIRYLPGLVAATPGTHDVLANPHLAGAPEIPYRVSEGCLWTLHCTIGSVLAHYRDLYAPSSGSPLVNAGDPADGAGVAIGAIGDGAHPLDRFGRVVPIS